MHLLPKLAKLVVVGWILLFALVLPRPSSGEPGIRQDSGTDIDKVRIGIYRNPPLIDMRGDGTPEGIFADIVGHIFQEAGWKPEYVAGEETECHERLEAGEIDLMVAVVYSTELGEKFLFTKEAIITNWAKVYAVDPSEVCSFLDLKGKNIAVLANDEHFVGINGLRALTKQFDIECTFIETGCYEDIFRAVKEGRADAGLVNRLFGTMKEAKYDLTGTAMIFNPQDVRIALSKKSKNAALLKETLDRYLTNLKRTSGSPYYRTLEKYLGVSGEPYARWPRWLLPVLYFGSFLLASLLAAGMFFRWQVGRKTNLLRQANERLQKDITLRRKAEDALRTSEENYRAIFNSANDAILVCDLSTGAIRDLNSKASEMFGYSLDEAREFNIGDLSSGDQPYTSSDAGEKVELASQGDPQLYVWMARDKDGHIFWTEINLKRSTIGGKDQLLAVVRDITRRKHLEEQYRQSQKMEAVGQLAGGVAHDFNNLLTAILGYSGFLSENLPEDDSAHNSAVMIHRAAKRAADLTRQLLAFSRKQVLAKRVLDLNEVIGNMEKMLRRVIGEDIELTTNLADSVSPVKADLSQIEQIVMNLALNARDAMPSGGCLSMETADVEFDDHYVMSHTDVRPGPYVMFSIVDTGIGMDPKILPRIFEPFYTMKADGKGTGLGLSTVYGIVKQHKGHISVSSEPENGTTFQVYLPSMMHGDDLDNADSDSIGSLSGTETILVVEDEDLVRKLAGRILEMHGYTVISSSDPLEARRISEEHKGELDLLLSDVIMPKMDGCTLFEDILKHRPGIRVLYMSGYASQSNLLRGVMVSERNFLQKPFTVETLTKAVRRVLDSPVPAIPEDDPPHSS